MVLGDKMNINKIMVNAPYKFSFPAIVFFASTVYNSFFFTKSFTLVSLRYLPNSPKKYNGLSLSVVSLWFLSKKMLHSSKNH